MSLASVSPPDVKKLGAQSEHLEDPSLSLYLWSKLHTSHLTFPARLYLPAGQDVGVPCPVHTLPASHVLQSVWVVEVPPVVYDPGGQVAHAVDPARANYMDHALERLKVGRRKAKERAWDAKGTDEQIQKLLGEMSEAERAPVERGRV